MSNLLSFTMICFLAASCSKKQGTADKSVNTGILPGVNLSVTPAAIPGNTTDTFTGGYTLQYETVGNSFDVTEKIDLPVMLYVSKMGRDSVHITSNTVIKAPLNGFPITIDFRISAIDMNWHAVNPEQLLELKKDTLFFRWIHRQLQKMPAGYEYIYSTGCLWGKKVKR